MLVKNRLQLETTTVKWMGRKMVEHRVEVHRNAAGTAGNHHNRGTAFTDVTGQTECSGGPGVDGGSGIDTVTSGRSGADEQCAA